MSDSKDYYCFGMTDDFFINNPVALELHLHISKYLLTNELFIEDICTEQFKISKFDAAELMCGLTKSICELAIVEGGTKFGPIRPVLPEEEQSDE